MEKVVILDNGHGRNTAGKRSPDGSIVEWEYTRDLVDKIKIELEILGYTVFKIVPEEEDIKLSVRASRANQIIAKYGASNCILVSVHCNAAGDGTKWMNGRGFEVWTTEGQNNSDRLAEQLCYACLDNGVKLRMDKTDGDMDREKNFTIIYLAQCPAVITENMFMDNKEDVEFLLSDDGFWDLVSIHVDGIHRYFGGPVSIIKTTD